MKKSKKTKEFVLDVTQEDYEKEIADGMPREYAMKPGKHVFRRGTFFDVESADVYTAAERQRPDGCDRFDAGNRA